MKRGRITIEDLKKWGVCYDHDKIDKLAKGRKSITYQEVANLDIPGYDKVWVLIHAMPDTQKHVFACDCAEHIIDAKKRPKAAELIRIKRLWVVGKATDEELEEARAAHRAADNAANDAAYDASYHAAYDAANDAAYWAAHSAADRAAEREWQVGRAVEILEG